MNEYTIGRLAGATGVTVRTLHHYDRIGLLTASERTPSGYRLYGPADVKRLYRILALRQLGLPLADVARALDGEWADLKEAVHRHIREVDRQIELGRRLKRRLRRLAAAVERSENVPIEVLVDAMEVIVMVDSYYTKEQLAQLAERAEKLGPDGMEQAQRDWADLIAAVTAEMRAGTDPSDPKVQELMVRWRALIEAFTGGDEGIRANLQRMYEEQGPEMASRGTVDPDLMAYVGRAMQT